MPIAVYVASPGPPPPPPVRGPLFYPEPRADDWQFSVGDWRGLPTYALGGENTPVTSRTVTWRLSPDTSDAAFTVSGDISPNIPLVEVDTDLWVTRNGQALYRGVLASSQASRSADALSISYTAADYRAVLAARMLYDTDSLVYAGLDQAQIVWNLISQAQAKPGGSMNLTQGVGQITGYVPPTQTFTPGAYLADLINQLGTRTTGFEWDITPHIGSVTQTFNVFYPQRGTDRRKIVDFPGQINSYTRSVDGTTFHNAVRATGASGLAPVTVQAAGLAGGPDRRLDGQYSDTNVQTADALAGAANKQLALQSTVSPSWVVTLKPNIWAGPADVWLGDPVLLSIEDGPYDVYETLRVQQIALTLDDNSDAATVALTLGTPNPNRRWRITQIDRRLRNIEKR